MAINKRTRSGIVFVVITMILGVVLAGLVMHVIKSFNEQVEVVVAAQEIPAYVQIKAEHLKVARVPQAAKSVGAYGKEQMGELVGKVTRTIILPDEQLRTGHLAGATTGSSLLAVQLTEMMDPNLRAYVIPVSSLTSVGGADKIQVGDRVDVLSCSRNSLESVKTVVASVPIMSFVIEEKKTVGIIVAVTTAQAEVLAYSISNGTVSLALNPVAMR